MAPSAGHKEPQAGKIRSDFMNLIESDLIQGGHHTPRTTLNKPFPAVKITVLTKAIYRCDAICIKLNGVSHRTRTKHFTVCMEIQNTLKSQNNLEKEEQELTGSGSLTSEYTTSYSNQREQDYTVEKRQPPQ